MTVLVSNPDHIQPVHFGKPGTADAEKEDEFVARYNLGDLVVGEWDVITPPEQGLALFKRLTQAKERRVTVLSEGSHCIGLEKNRMHLIREVQNFLEEPAE